MTFEIWILDQLQRGSNPILDKFWVAITHLGDGGILFILLAVFLMVFKSTRKVGFMCLLSILIGALLTNGLLKNLVQRSRPFTQTDISLLIKAPNDFSFPSGHTTASFAFAFVMMKTNFKRMGVPIAYLSLFLASLIAFSRLYLYVHYPSDILAGLVIAFLASHVAYELVEKRNIIKF